MPRRPRQEGEAITRRADLWRKVGEPGPGTHYRGYVRFSHEAGHYGLTTDGQKKDIHGFGDARQWICDGIDVEPARSAKYEDIEERPIFRKHLETVEKAARAGQPIISLCYMNDRWARNKGVAYVSLSRLRRAGVYWATTDSRWNIDRIEEDGWDVAYGVDVAMNAAYSRKVSEKTRKGKQTRASLGLRNGDLMYGYTTPPDAPRPFNAPQTWKAPRQADIAHPENFERLQLLGEWAASGKSDQQIAEEANAKGWMTQTEKPIGSKKRFTGVDEDGQPQYEHEYVGPRPFSKDTVRCMLIRPYPREFAPGCGKGTILAPNGERLMGQHPAAWSWELWHRMDEARARRRGGSRGQERIDQTKKYIWPFSGMVVCAACGTRLRVNSFGRKSGVNWQGIEDEATAFGRYAYYQDRALHRGIPCAAGGNKSVLALDLDSQFAALLTSHPLPHDWRERAVTKYSESQGNTNWQHVEKRKNDLETERQRLKFQHQHGWRTDDEMVREMQRIQQALDQLPQEGTQERLLQRTIAAAETLSSLHAYWEAADQENRLQFVTLLLQPEGITYDLERRCITALRPRQPFLVPLLMALTADSGKQSKRRTGSQPPAQQGHWIERDGELLLISADQHQSYQQKYQSSSTDGLVG